MIEVYVASSQDPSANKGGWGVVLVEENGEVKKESGSEEGATHNAMILKAAIEGISKTEQGCEVRLLTNVQYLEIGMKDSRQRRANRDLWQQLDDLVSRRHIDVQRRDRGKWLSEAQVLAREAIRV